LDEGNDIVANEGFVIFLLTIFIVRYTILFKYNKINNKDILT